MLSHEAMRRLFDVAPERSDLGNFAPLAAIYPKGDAPVVLIDDDGERRLETSSWGFLTPKKSKKTADPRSSHPLSGSTSRGLDNSSLKINAFRRIRR